ncbi:hypothetical protein O181_004305 [Austropuccinia psidii MF-1]|uniref:Chromo domain-containing protein n=1 Tax=Austropuccinia psidii MF-1 TaxID=1389203 RepID=A0A9Q3GEQ9_9BASI|nr:hypothetical protein [Austropuccinia psidii MF-1]
MDLPPSYYHDSLEELWDEEEKPEEVENVMKVVPSVYHQYLDVFSKVKAEELPPHHACDHHIKLEGSLPPVGVIYSLSNQESDTLRAYISDNVEKGFIWPRCSLTGAPFLFVKKKDDGLCLCFDYHKLNAVTWKNKYPVPPMNKLLNVFNGSSIFSKIDRHGAYNLLRIKEGYKHLTTFRTKYGSYEYLVMPFGLTNAPASFQSLVNDIFQDLLDVFVVACLDDIMVFSKSEEGNITHMSTVLTRLRANKLFAKPSKCLSHVTSKALWKDSQYRSIPQELGKGKSVQYYSLDSSPQRLLLKDLVVVPNDPRIQLSILQKCHDSPLAGHPGQEKTLKIFKQDFHWSVMTQFIKDYVSSCQQCSRNKNIHHKKFGLLKPLPIPNGPWICLSIDFITQLPLSNSFDSILDIVDSFSKMVVFIPTMSSITSLDLAHLFIKNIFSKNGLPSSILNISRDLSTAYHPETDGQTERINQILGKYLWMYVNYHQYDYNTWLPLAEFSYNCSAHSSTKQSPFFTVYGRDPQFDSVHFTQDTPSGTLSTKIQSVQQDLNRELEVAINRFKRYEDKSRASPPIFNPGDMVWLSSKRIKSTRPTKKLSERWLGPFPILKDISTHAYHLKLPFQWKSIHPVFHISLLEPVNTSTIPNQHQEPPPPIIIKEEEEWEVSQILVSNLKRGKLWYLMEWKGFSQDPDRSTWEPIGNLKNCHEPVKHFHSLYPDKPGPNS